MAEKHCIQNQQFGFQPSTSTAHAITYIKQDVAAALKLRQSTVMVLFDIEKAFDTVWHKGLLSKMIYINFPPWIIKFISSDLSNRTFFVTIDEGGRSSFFPVSAGLPQGSVVGLPFFTIYLNDIPVSPKVDINMFADDTTSRSSDLDPQVAMMNVQTHLNALESYYNKWKIKINVEKSE